MTGLVANHSHSRLEGRIECTCTAAFPPAAASRGDERWQTNRLQGPSVRQTTDWADAPTHRAISTHDLMAGERVIIIRHGKEEYRLRITASDKLILTK